MAESQQTPKKRRSNVQKNKTTYIPISSDNDVNDEGYIWGVFNNKPSNITIYSMYNGASFWTVLHDKVSKEDIIINGEVIISDDDVFHTYRYLIKLDKDIYITFYEYRNDFEHKISNIKFYYNSISKSIEEINQYLDIFNESVETENVNQHSINYMTYDQSGGGILIEPLPNKISYKPENSDLLDIYPENQHKDMRKMIKKINSNEKGIYLIYGDYGTGKTKFIGNICEESEKSVIIIPFNIIQSFFTSLDFIEILRQNSNSLFIIEDADGLFLNENEIGLSQMVQSIKGIINDSITSSFLFTYNTTSVSNIPKKVSNFSNMSIKFEKNKNPKSNYF